MTEWCIADFLMVDPTDPLLAFLADRPEWRDEVSLLAPAVTPDAFEAYLHWLLAEGRVSYRAMLRCYQALLAERRQKGKRWGSAASPMAPDTL